MSSMGIDEERERRLDALHKMLNDPSGEQKEKKRKQAMIWKTALTPEQVKEVEKIKNKEAEKREREGKAGKADQ